MTMTRITLTAITGLMISLTTGCSSLGSHAGNSFVLGKLYTMQETLNQAAAQCDNGKSLERAGHWALIGRDDIQQSIAYMNPESSEFLQANNLLGSLSSVISAARQPQERQCNAVRIAANDANRYITSLTNPSIVVAAR